MPTEILQLNQQNNQFDAFLTDSNGDPLNIATDLPIDMEFRKPDNTKVTENAITVVDAPTGHVRYTEATTSKTNIIGAWEYRPVTNSKVTGKWIQFVVED